MRIANRPQPRNKPSNLTKLKAAFVCTLAWIQCCGGATADTVAEEDRAPVQVVGQTSIEPAPKFFDADEARIYRDFKPKSADLLEFIDTNSSKNVPIGCVKKPWTSDEKAEVRRITDRLLLVVPSLVISAANNRKIFIFRSKSLSIDHDPGSNPEKASDVCALAYPNGIVLSDRFFRANHRIRMFAHELVHVSDATASFAYSKAWTSLMGTKIRDAGIALRNLPREEAGARLRQLRRQGLIPTVHACKNLSEALAEVVSSTIDGTFEPNGELLNLVREFLASNLSRRDSDERLAAACWAMDVQCYDKASTILSDLTKHCNSPLVRYYMALCNLALHNYSESLRCCSEALSQIKEQRIPYCEDVSVNICFLQEYCLSIRGEYVESLSVSDRLLSEVLFDDLFLHERCFTERALSDIANSCVHLYLCCFATTYLAQLRDAPSNQTLMTDLLNKTVSQFPHYRVGFLQRGYFEQWQGMHELQPEMRHQYYLRALADYQKALALEEKANCGAALYCCDLCLKLGQSRDAEAYCAKAAQEDASAVEARFMRTMVLARHSETEAAVCLDEIVADLLRQHKLKYSILERGSFNIQKNVTAP